MDKLTFYTNQLVEETDMLEIFEYAEDTEISRAVDNGMAQTIITDPTYNPAEHGGILEGLVVTVLSDTKIQITAGVCVDDAGNCIRVPQTATVYITNQGDTAIADPHAAMTDAVATGLAMAVPATYTWVGLFLKYGEYVHDQVTDPLDPGGAKIDYRLLDSYRFSFMQCANGDNTRAAAPLANGRVHLADICIMDDGTGVTIKVKKDGATYIIAGTDAQFDLYSGPPDFTAMTGRRSDWIAIENPTDFPLTAAADAIREGNPRRALYRTVKQLQKNTTTCGAQWVGARVQTGAAPAAARSAAEVLPAGSVDTQLLAIADKLSTKLATGGGSTLATVSGVEGLTVDTTSQDAARHAVVVKTNGQELDRLYDTYGQSIRRHEFFDEFIYAGGATNLFPLAWRGVAADQPCSPWSEYLDTGGGTIEMYNPTPDTGDNVGGIATIIIPNLSTDEYGVCTGYGATGLHGMAWNMGAAPYIAGGVRFRIPNDHADMKDNINMRCGLHTFEDAGTQEFAIIYTASATELTAYLDNGAANTSVSLGNFTPGAGIVTLVQGQWVTVRWYQVDDKNVVVQASTGGSVTAWKTLTLAASMPSFRYQMFMYAQGDNHSDIGMAKAVHFDRIWCSDARLSDGL